MLIQQPGQAGGGSLGPTKTTDNDDMCMGYVAVGSQPDGLKKLGIEQVPPMATRGVVLDMLACTGKKLGVHVHAGCLAHHRRCAGHHPPGGDALNRLRLSAGALLLAVAGAAAAHPLGRIDGLVPRLQFDAQGQLAGDKPVRQFADLVAGMFRQSGWMLKLQVLGADQAAPGLLTATGVRAPSGTIRCPAP